MRAQQEYKPHGSQRVAGGCGEKWKGEMKRDIVLHGDQQRACLLLADMFFGAGTSNSYLAKFVSAHNRSAVCSWHLFALRRRSIYSTGHIPICRNIPQQTIFGICIDQHLIEHIIIFNIVFDILLHGKMLK